MKERKRRNWSAFGMPESKWSLLTRVSHVTHVHTALKVLRSGMVTPGLCDGRLKKKGIEVVFLSPNEWDCGSYFGNIAFELDWDSLLAGKQFYWVGAMPYRRKLAPRILVTEREPGDGMKLRKYDPRGANGPWAFDDSTGQHHRNGARFLQFMLEAAVPLDHVTLRFVRHHDNYCVANSRDCPDLGEKKKRAGARFLAGACAESLLGRHPLLWTHEDRTPRRVLRRAWGELESVISRKVVTWPGPIRATASEAAPGARRVLEAVRDWRTADRREQAMQFQSAQDLVEACAQLIEGDLGLARGTLDRADDAD